MTEELAVLAVVLATRGGTRLERALASVPWARERAVLDPAGDVAAGALPAGVRLGRDVTALATLGDAPWVLLLCEDEVATPVLHAAVARVAPGAPGAWRVGVAIDALGLRFIPARAPVRLGPRAQARLVVDRSLTLALDVPQASAGRLDGSLCAERGGSVAELFDALEPETRAWAALLAQLDARPGAGTLAAAPLLALARMLRARASARAGLARWVTAVFAAYRVVLAHARLWEWRHAQPAPVREVA